MALATTPRRASKSHPSSSDGKTRLTDFSKKSQPTLPVRDVTHITGHILYLEFLLWHLWMTRPLPHAREHLRSCLHLTERKVLSLTKPKGKIYKTKSLGHYIIEAMMSKYLNKSVIILDTCNQNVLLKHWVVQVLYFSYSPGLIQYLSFLFPKQKIHLKSKIWRCKGTLKEIQGVSIYMGPMWLLLY